MNLEIGDTVLLKAPLSYLKTADPMPMLRPPDLVSPEEPGQIVAIKTMGIVVVRFRRGTFLIPIDRLTKSSVKGD